MTIRSTTRNIFMGKEPESASHVSLSVQTLLWQQADWQSELPAHAEKLGTGKPRRTLHEFFDRQCPWMQQYCASCAVEQSESQ